jgi:hypothetical protein
MSIEKCRKWLGLILALICMAYVSALAERDSTSDPVLRFYCEKARTTCADRNPIEQGLFFSFTTTTYIKKLDRRGEVTGIDTATADLFFSHGNLDSQKTAALPTGAFSPPEFAYPNVFTSDYQFNLFPNDTGGAYLAIGFDSDSADDPRPVGLAIIDRYDYSLHRLYLFYPHQENFKRFSRIFHFIEHDEYIFPDSISEVAVKMGIFSSDHYQREIVISNIKILR